MARRLLLLFALFGSLNLMADPTGPVVDEPQEPELEAQAQPVEPPPIEIEQIDPQVTALPGSAAAAFVDIRNEYRKRWDADGHFINDKKLRDAFIKKQDELGQRFRDEGRIAKSIEVKNSFNKSVVFIVSVIQENGAFVGLMIERNKYDLKEQEAALRFLDLPLLQHGTVLLQYSNVDVISLRAENFDFSTGGGIFLKYPTNFKNNSFGETGFAVTKNAEGNFTYASPEQVEFSTIDLHIWVKPFAGPNFGIDTVTFH